MSFNAGGKGDAQTKRLLDKFRRTIEQGLGQTRDKSKRWITEEDLGDANIVRKISGAAPNLSAGNTPTDFTPPPVPTGLAVVGGINYIHITFDKPTDLYKAHGLTSIYRNTTDNFSTAVIIHQTIGLQAADLDVTRNTDYYYWITYTGSNGIEGAPNSPSGTVGRLSSDPQEVLALLEGEILESSLADSLRQEIERITPIAEQGETLAQELEFVKTQIGTDGNQTIAQRVDELSTTVGENSSTIQQTAESIDGLSASLTFKLDINGSIGGFGISANGNNYDSNVDFAAIFAVDTFGITSPDATTLTFGVNTRTNRVGMSGADILDASITDAQIENLSAEKVTGITASFLLARIGEGSITNAYIGNVIEHDNYVAGVSGWIIRKDGSCEFEDVRARGDIEATSLKADTAEIVDTIHIRGGAVYLADEEIDNTAESYPINNLVSVNQFIPLFDLDLQDAGESQSFFFPKAAFSITVSGSQRIQRVRYIANQGSSQPARFSSTYSFSARIYVELMRGDTVVKSLFADRTSTVSRSLETTVPGGDSTADYPSSFTGDSVIHRDRSFDATFQAVRWTLNFEIEDFMDIPGKGTANYYLRVRKLPTQYGSISNVTKNSSTVFYMGGQV